MRSLETRGGAFDDDIKEFNSYLVSVSLNYNLKATFASEKNIFSLIFVLRYY